VGSDPWKSSPPVLELLHGFVGVVDEATCLEVVGLNHLCDLLRLHESQFSGIVTFEEIDGVRGRVFVSQGVVLDTAGSTGDL